MSNTICTTIAPSAPFPAHRPRAGRAQRRDGGPGTSRRPLVPTAKSTLRAASTLTSPWRAVEHATVFGCVVDLSTDPDTGCQ
jgi:hypothetical protein